MTCLGHRAALLALALWLLSGADASGAATPPPSLQINGAQIRGIEQVRALKPRYHSGEHLDEVHAACQKDGLDEIVFLKADSTAYLAYGRHVHLYARVVDRVTSARVAGQPVRIIMIDDENRGLDVRPMVGPRTAAGLLFVVILGVLAGLASGLFARRSLAALGRDPMLEHVFYGLVLGLSVALLIYGLSGKRFELGMIFQSAADAHLAPFLDVVSPT